MGEATGHVLLVLALVTPMVLLALVAILKGYDISMSIRPRHRRRRRDDDTP